MPCGDWHARDSYTLRRLKQTVSKRIQPQIATYPEVLVLSNFPIMCDESLFFGGWLQFVDVRGL
jgi:hypothetical protein